MYPRPSIPSTNSAPATAESPHLDKAASGRIIRTGLVPKRASPQAEREKFVGILPYTSLSTINNGLFEMAHCAVSTVIDRNAEQTAERCSKTG